MNLERIHFKVQNDSLLILNQISELKKLNLLVRFDASLYSEQTINTGGKIRALNLKSVEQFKGLKPFNVLSETQLLDLYQIGVLENLDKYNFKINVSDLVNYNNRNFIVLGVVVNTYAQWNLPTPLLFNPNAMSNDVKSLYGSRLTEVQIVERINDNFQKGKYDNDIVIPLVDMAKPKDVISVVKPIISEKDTLDIFSKILKLKNADFEIKKDVFINTIADLKAEEIISLKSRDEDLYNSFNLFTKSLNDIINKKIESIPASEKEKPARKPRAKKEVAPVVEKELLTDFTNTKFWFGDNLELGKKVMARAVELGWRETDLDSITDSFYFDNDSILRASSGKDFFDKQVEREIFYEDLFGKEIPKTTSVEPEPILDELQVEIPEVKTQEVKAVELIVYPPKGGVINIRTESLYELHDISRFVLNKFKMKTMRFNFNAITDLASYTTQISFKENDSQDDILRNLLEQYDTFVKPELNWKNFDERQGDIDRMNENEKIVNIAFEVEVEKKPFFAPPTKPIEVKKAKAIVIDKKKIEEKKKEIEQLAKAKPIKITKPKITKPKVEDDLSFLDDLDNIF
jgi:hypothetical protein